jgi:DNA-binding XRE family transcriptional regulator
MENIKVYTHEEVLDRVLGTNTAARAEYESDTEDYLVGLAIRRAREAQNLTQEELGKRIGVQRARICSIEKGTNLRLSTLRRIFSALGLEVKLDIANQGQIALC